MRAFTRATRSDYFATIRARAADPRAFDRFIAKVRIGSSFECWPWVAATFRDGPYGRYGRVTTPAGNRGAHRMAHLFFHGDAGPLEVRHLCHNPICVNPGHLRSGTHRDNMQDRKAAGRGGYLKGSSNGRAVLNEQQVAAILASSESGAALARRYGVSKVTTCGIKRRAKWKHVNEEKQ